jgi:hypothetical protein
MSIYWCREEEEEGQEDEHNDRWPQAKEKWTGPLSNGLVRWKNADV